MPQLTGGMPAGVVAADIWPKLTLGAAAGGAAACGAEKDTGRVAAAVGEAPSS